MVAVAIGGAAVLGAGASVISGNKASKAQQQAADASVAEQRRQYDQTRADYAPWREAGKSALSRLNAEMTGGPSTAFVATPGYQFRMDQSLKALERMQSARGQWNSGATRSALLERAGNLASSEYGDWWNRNAGLAGVGQTATDATTQAGLNTTNQISNSLQQAGNARASSYANTGSAINSGINNVLAAYLYQQGGGFGR